MQIMPTVIGADLMIGVAVYSLLAIGIVAAEVIAALKRNSNLHAD